MRERFFSILFSIVWIFATKCITVIKILENYILALEKYTSKLTYPLSDTVPGKMDM